MIFAVFILSGCASILNPKMQKVLVSTGVDNATVYIDNKKEGTGSMVPTKMVRDGKARQLKIEREGCKDEYLSVMQNKKSPLYILSIVPFGVLCYPMFYDNGPKSYDYYGMVLSSAPLPIKKRQEGQKYMFLTKSGFNIKKENFKIGENSYKNHLKGKKPYTKPYEPMQKQGETNAYDIQNSIYTDYINDILKANGYVDTVNKVFKDYSNSVYVEAEVVSLTFTEINSNRVFNTIHYASCIDATANIKWKVMDVYDQVLYTVETESKSGTFSTNFYQEGTYIKKSLEDLLLTSFLQMVNKPEVQTILKIEEIAEAAQEQIKLVKPSVTTTSVELAKSATATIKCKKGFGSGCVISQDGYILTNYHVVAGETDFQVLTDDERTLPAKLVRYNTASDLALIKVDASFNAAYVLSTEKNYGISDEVFAIGTPTSIELGQTISKGIISSIRKVRKSEFIQTDVSVNSGNSGGALIKKNGELIGVVNSKVKGLGVEGIAFCIPSSIVFSALNLGY